MADPKFTDGDTLKTFDYVVANPPFSDKRWSTGLDPANDSYERFKPFGVPPAKQGDYAYLLHIVTLKSTGKGLHPAARRALPGQCRGRHPPRLVRKGYIGHHRPAYQPVLRHRHPRLHHRRRQGGRPRARASS